MPLSDHQIVLPGIKKIIAVVSGKGGVGKTFIASSIAIALAKIGKRVGLLDADITCPNIFTMLGINQKLILTSDQKIIPAERFGLKIVSMAGLCETEDEPIAWRGPILSKILQKLIKESVWGELDVLVVDVPSGSSDSALTILQNLIVDGAVIVTAPNRLSTIGARKAINMAISLKVPIVGIIENMRGDIFGEGGGLPVADKYKIQFLGSIAMRKQIVNLCDAGTPPIFQLEELEMIFTKIVRIISEKVVI